MKFENPEERANSIAFKIPDCIWNDLDSSWNRRDETSGKLIQTEIPDDFLCKNDEYNLVKNEDYSAIDFPQALVDLLEMPPEDLVDYVRRYATNLKEIKNKVCLTLLMYYKLDFESFLKINDALGISIKHFAKLCAEVNNIKFMELIKIALNQAAKEANETIEAVEIIETIENYAFMLAVKNGYIEILDSLGGEIWAENFYRGTLLAIATGNMNMLHYLLENWAKKETEQQLMLLLCKRAVYKKKPEILKYLMWRYSDGGHYDLAKKMLALPTESEHSYPAVLFDAFAQKDFDTLKILVDRLKTIYSGWQSLILGSNYYIIYETAEQKDHIFLSKLFSLFDPPENLPSAIENTISGKELAYYDPLEMARKGAKTFKNIGKSGDIETFNVILNEMLKFQKLKKENPKDKNIITQSCYLALEGAIEGERAEFISHILEHYKEINKHMAFIFLDLAEMGYFNKFQALAKKYPSEFRDALTKNEYTIFTKVARIPDQKKSEFRKKAGSILTFSLIKNENRESRDKFFTYLWDSLLTNKLPTSKFVDLIKTNLYFFSELVANEENKDLLDQVINFFINHPSKASLELHKLFQILLSHSDYLVLKKAFESNRNCFIKLLNYVTDKEATKKSIEGNEELFVVLTQDAQSFQFIEKLLGISFLESAMKVCVLRRALSFAVKEKNFTHCNNLIEKFYSQFEEYNLSSKHLSFFDSAVVKEHADFIDLLMQKTIILAYAEEAGFLNFQPGTHSYVKDHEYYFQSLFTKHINNLLDNYKNKSVPLKHFIDSQDPELLFYLTRAFIRRNAPSSKNKSSLEHLSAEDKSQLDVIFFDKNVIEKFVKLKKDGRTSLLMAAADKDSENLIAFKKLIKFFFLEEFSKGFSEYKNCSSEFQNIIQEEEIHYIKAKLKELADITETNSFEVSDEEVPLLFNVVKGMIRYKMNQGEYKNIFSLLIQNKSIIKEANRLTNGKDALKKERAEYMLNPLLEEAAREGDIEAYEALMENEDYSLKAFLAGLEKYEVCIDTRYDVDDQYKKQVKSNIKKINEATQLTIAQTKLNELLSRTSNESKSSEENYLLSKLARIVIEHHGQEKIFGEDEVYAKSLDLLLTEEVVNDPMYISRSRWIHPLLKLAIDRKNSIALTKLMKIPGFAREAFAVSLHQYEIKDKKIKEIIDKNWDDLVQEELNLLVVRKDCDLSVKDQEILFLIFQTLLTEKTEGSEKIGETEETEKTEKWNLEDVEKLFKISALRSQIIKLLYSNEARDMALSFFQGNPEAFSLLTKIPVPLTPVQEDLGGDLGENRMENLLDDSGEDYVDIPTKVDPSSLEMTLLAKVIKTYSPRIVEKGVEFIKKETNSSEEEIRATTSESIIKEDGIYAVLESFREILKKRFLDNARAVLVTPEKVTLPDEGKTPKTKEDKIPKRIKLPVDYTAFEDLLVRHSLSPASYPKFLEVYYRNPDHTALRFLSEENPWIAKDALWAQGDSRMRSVFFEFREVIAILCLAVMDEEELIDGYTMEERLSFFIQQLAIFGRLDNENQPRPVLDENGEKIIDSNGKEVTAEFDDFTTPDRPGCPSRFVMTAIKGVKGHRLLTPFTEIIQLELIDFLQKHFAKEITGRNYKGLSQALHAIEEWSALKKEEREALSAINISDEKIKEWVKYLEDKYGEAIKEYLPQLKKKFASDFHIITFMNDFNKNKFLGKAKSESVLVEISDLFKSEQKQSDFENLSLENKENQLLGYYVMQEINKALNDQERTASSMNKLIKQLENKLSGKCARNSLLLGDPLANYGFFSHSRTDLGICFDSELCSKVLNILKNALGMEVKKPEAKKASGIGLEKGPF